jgi:folate-binding protein YgfZ
MMMTPLPHRGVLEIQGEDKAAFLQGLLSNEVHEVTPERALYATLLTPQGRFLYDFFIIEQEGSYFLDVEAHRLSDLIKKLSLYKLRSRVLLIPRPDLKVFALWGEGVTKTLNLQEERGNSHAGFYLDPRLDELGVRAMLLEEPQGFSLATVQDYDLHRIKLGVPEGGLDLIPEKSILLELGLDELNAINWKKGCYVGQELTTRSKFLGLVRKRLFPVKIEGPSPAFGDEIFLDDTPVGVMRSSQEEIGLALLRLEHLTFDEDGQGPALRCQGAILHPYKPLWMVLPKL